MLCKDTSPIVAPPYPWGPCLNKLEFTLPDDAWTTQVTGYLAFSFCLVFEKIFENYWQIFNNTILSPLLSLFIWTNLNPFCQIILRAKFGLNWLSGSGEKDENVNSLRQQWRRQQWWRTMDKFWFLAQVSL